MRRRFGWDIQDIQDIHSQEKVRKGKTTWQSDMDERRISDKRVRVACFSKRKRWWCRRKQPFSMMSSLSTWALLDVWGEGPERVHWEKGFRCHFSIDPLVFCIDLLVILSCTVWRRKRRITTRDFKPDPATFWKIAFYPKLCKNCSRFQRVLTEDQDSRQERLKHPSFFVLRLWSSSLEAWSWLLDLL